jgi:internalin A
MSPKPRRRWYQFRLSTLLIGLTLISLPLGYVAWEREECRRGSQALAMFDQNASSTTRKVERAPSKRSDWLKLLLGDDRFRGVNSIELSGGFVANSDLRPLVDFPNLRNLKIESPYLTDEGVAYLAKLKRVEKFQFIHNRRISASSWGLLDGWHHLRFLSFEDSDFCNDGALDFSALSNLTELDLSQTNITSVGLDRVSLPANLEVLNLSTTEVADADLQHLNHLLKLRKLDLSSTYVRGSGLAYNPALLRLESLNLIATNLSDEGLAFVSQLENLKSLQLASTKISDAGLAQLTDLGRLESLDISYNRISDKGLLHLSQLKNLKKLLLESTAVTSEGVQDLQRALPQVSISY